MKGMNKDMRSKTCCFTGHRKLPGYKLDHIMKRLEHEVETLIAQGVTTFISGGALGFDQIAASLIAEKKKEQNIRLVFALPCRNQNEFWSADQKRLYRELLTKADEIIYVSEEYYDGCMKKRNHHMVDLSAYCICACLYSASGTGQTVKYARQKGLRVINVVED